MNPPAVAIPADVSPTTLMPGPPRLLTAGPLKLWLKASPCEDDFAQTNSLRSCLGPQLKAFEGILGWVQLQTKLQEQNVAMNPLRPDPRRGSLAASSCLCDGRVLDQVYQKDPSFQVSGKDQMNKLTK